MTEAFLHYLWKLKCFHADNLCTVDGEPLQILKPGLHNQDSGPDFFNAQLRIGETHWAGNVEIHIRSSDWKNHSHDQDAAYDNIILHVVHEHDEPVLRNDGSKIPTLELKTKIDERLWTNYSDLLESRQWIACQHRIREIEPLTIDPWLDRLLTERLERKTKDIEAALQHNNNDWETTFYHHLARNFGFRLNGLPFELLAKSLPVITLARHKDQLFQLEAMLFGQAGMLNQTFRDNYPVSLRYEYEFLRMKFNLMPMPFHAWKFLRLRPLNFPTIRIAQFAQLVHASSHLFSRILDCESLDGLKNLFRVSVSPYWQQHFLFDKVTQHQNGQLGEQAIENILINTVVPFLFAFGKNRGTEEYQQRAIHFLEKIPEEKNSILDGWKALGIQAQSAYRSQALLQLKNEYCDGKRCLNCRIGNAILQKLKT